MRKKWPVSIKITTPNTSSFTDMTIWICFLSVYSVLNVIDRSPGAAVFFFPSSIHPIFHFSLINLYHFPRRMRDRVHESHSPVSPYNIQNCSLPYDDASGNIRRRIRYEYNNDDSEFVIDQLEH